MKINRWFYMAVVIVVTIALCAYSETGKSNWPYIFATYFVAAATFPFGLLPVLVVLSLVYVGLATPAEALAVASPFCAVLGYFQWYVLLPRWYRRSDI
jgi:TRAP-type C4-dicarboxylate transport system permease large subunit